MSLETELRAPVFLIAVPQLGDPNFVRGVVLILEHGDKGSMGLIVNRPSKVSMGAFCNSQKVPFAGNPRALVYQGGPVQTDRAFILHDAGPDGPETEVLTPDLRLSYSLESLRLLAKAPPSHLRIFMGYAGWGPDQLAEEVSGGAWLVATPSAPFVFAGNAEQVWEGTLREQGIEPVQLVHSGSVH